VAVDNWGRVHNLSTTACERRVGGVDPPEADHPHRYTHRMESELASVYWALAGHETRLAYPEALERAHTEFADLDNTGS
jgi:hypothetical protein